MSINNNNLAESERFEQQNMKHEKIIDRVLREVFFDISWMNEADYEECLYIFFLEMGLSKRKLLEDMETGVNNGITPRKQAAIIKQSLKDLK